MSTGCSPVVGSQRSLLLGSLHSKLLLMEKLVLMPMSVVSLPVMTSGGSNWPVTTQLPAGMGEVALMGLGTVVPAARPVSRAV